MLDDWNHHSSSYQKWFSDIFLKKILDMLPNELLKAFFGAAIIETFLILQFLIRSQDLKTQIALN